jgi:steroid delta-isomerase-like uncharacterized protein
VTSTEENKATVSRFYAALDAGDLAALDDLVAEDYVDHNPPHLPDLATGREGLKQAFMIFLDATPGRHRILQQTVEGDRVVTYLHAEGRHERDLPGVPATGAELSVTAVAIHRVDEGRLAEHWSCRDDLALMTQLGVVEPPS